MNTETAVTELVQAAYKLAGGEGVTEVEIMKPRRLTMTEHEIQATFFNVLRHNEPKFPQLKWIYAVPNGGHRHPITAAKMKAEGVKSGIWDVCIPVPQPMDECPGAWIEFKAGRNKLTPEQEAFRDHLMSHGYEFAVCRTPEEGWEFVEGYLGIELRK